MNRMQVFLNLFPNKPIRILISVLFILWLGSFIAIFVHMQESFAFKPAPEQIEERPKCPLCTFTPLHPPTSTRRDVILAAALTELKRVEYFLRTLRTTGTRARVILFLDNEETASKDWRRFFTACDIEPVFVKQVDPVIRSAPKLSRYYFYQQWLRKHIDEVDRVIHTDTFDVIFQSDPFWDGMDACKLYFTFEPVTLAGSHWTYQWMQQCYDRDVVSKYADQPVSCSGVTAGGGKVFLKYLDILLSTPLWSTCFGHSLDQAHHNYLLYSGVFADNGLQIEGLDCNSVFLTMHFCCKRAKCKLDEQTGVMYGNNSAVAPVLVHQYNRWKNLTNRNPVFCPAPASGVLSLTKKATAAQIEPLPPLMTSLPKETLWPPDMQPKKNKKKKL